MGGALPCCCNEGSFLVAQALCKLYLSTLGSLKQKGMG